MPSEGCQARQRSRGKGAKSPGDLDSTDDSDDALDRAAATLLTLTPLMTPNDLRVLRHAPQEGFELELEERRLRVQLGLTGHHLE